ncbi:helix-turn-helix domain-containing protein [Vibrio gangliei]|uniref:helix-turn-helix domain-containing protein n=1 Tax=Vibrio gangliei TaxID=2077090 RepID=UPI000D01B4B6|nr:helix-turn-helix domain-containing protein [Vibrio gangliei]
MELSPVFARRLYIALLIKDLERPNVPKLMAITGWPRRTIQDVLKALPAIGIHLSFIQDGRRHNDGYYMVNNWGPFDVRILKNWKTDIANFLGLPASI